MMMSNQAYHLSNVLDTRCSEEKLIVGTTTRQLLLYMVIPFIIPSGGHNWYTRTSDFIFPFNFIPFGVDCFGNFGKEANSIINQLRSSLIQAKGLPQYLATAN